MFRLVVAAGAMLAIVLGAWKLEAGFAGLSVSRMTVGGVPLTLFRPAGTGPWPVVVIAHGFAGSQQLMQPYAVTLARNGYLVATFDFPGHGGNAAPMPGPEVADAGRAAVLLDALEAVIAAARARPDSDGRLALLGHSMGADIVARLAAARPDVLATVGVSLVSHAVDATRPARLLAVVGELEPPMLHDAARRMVAQAPGERRMVVAPGVEHVGVLYSATALAASVAWLDAAFGRQGSGFVEHRAPWLGVLFGGVVALAWPLARLLPAGVAAPGGRWPWLAILAPPVLAPLLLWGVPTDFLAILLGDYLAVHFAVYGLLTAAALRWAGVPFPPLRRTLPVAAAALAGWSLVALGVPIDRYLAGFVPTPGRLALVGAMLLGLLPFFVADEWLTRACRYPALAYGLTKLLYLGSLGLAVALDPPRLFFLMIIIPVMVLFLLIFGLFSSFAFQRTGDPLVGGVGNAVALSWAIAVTFPMVG